MYIAASSWPSPATGFPNAAAAHGLTAPLPWVPEAEGPSQMPVTQAPPAVALLALDAGTWLLDALMAVDRLVVSTGLLVLLGGAGLVAVARLPTPAWRLTRRMEGRAWWLLRIAWWATLVGTLAGLLLHGLFTPGIPLRQAPATLLTLTVGTRFGVVWAVRVLLLLLLVAFLRAWSQGDAPWTRSGAWVAVGVLAAALAATPPLGGHAATGPYPVVGAILGGCPRVMQWRQPAATAGICRTPC